MQQEYKFTQGQMWIQCQGGGIMVMKRRGVPGLSFPQGISHYLHNLGLVSQIPLVSAPLSLRQGNDTNFIFSFCEKVGPLMQGVELIPLIIHGILPTLVHESPLSYFFFSLLPLAHIPLPYHTQTCQCLVCMLLFPKTLCKCALLSYLLCTFYFCNWNYILDVSFLPVSHSLILSDSSTTV